MRKELLCASLETKEHEMCMEYKQSLWNTCFALRKGVTETQPQKELVKAIYSLKVHLEDISMAKIRLRATQNRIMTIWEKVVAFTTYVHNNTIIPRIHLLRKIINTVIFLETNTEFFFEGSQRSTLTIYTFKTTK